jgi:hypothetical protein
MFFALDTDHHVAFDSKRERDAWVNSTPFAEATPEYKLTAQEKREALALYNQNLRRNKDF